MQEEEALRWNASPSSSLWDKMHVACSWEQSDVILDAWQSLWNSTSCFAPFGNMILPLENLYLDWCYQYLKSINLLLWHLWKSSILVSRIYTWLFFAITTIWLGRKKNTSECGQRLGRVMDYRNKGFTTCCIVGEVVNVLANSKYSGIHTDKSPDVTVVI